MGEGLAGGVVAEGDDTPEAAFGSDAFAIDGEGFGKKFAVCHEPDVEGTGEFDGADAVDDVVDGSVTGHGEEAGFLVALGQADGTALVLIKGGAFVPDGFDIASPADEAVNDEGEHGAEGVADGFGVAGVGEAAESLAQGLKFGAFEGAAGSGGVAIGDGGLVDGREDARSGEEGCCFFFQGAYPEVLGLFGILIEVAAVALEAFGVPEGQPVGGFVEGAGVLFGIVEAFRHKGLEAVAGFIFTSEGA